MSKRSRRPSATRDHIDRTTMLPRKEAFNAYRRTLEKNGTPFVAMMIDIDHFKRTNDTLGHDSADLILRAVAQAAKGLVERYRDARVFRWGGEEFIAVIPNYSVGEAEALAARLRAELSLANCDLGEGELAPLPTVTIGIAGPNIESRRAMACADLALRIGKQNGRDQAVVYTVSLDRSDSLRVVLNPQVFSGIGKSLRITFLHTDRYHHDSGVVETSSAPFKCASVLGPYDLMLTHFAKSDRQFTADLKAFLVSIGHDTDAHAKYCRQFVALRILKFHGKIVTDGEIITKRRVLRQLVKAVQAETLPRPSLRQRWLKANYLLKMSEARDPREGEIETYMTISLSIPTDPEGTSTDYIVDKFRDNHLLHDPRVFSLYEGNGTIANVRFVARTRCSQTELFKLIEDLHRHAEDASLRAHTGTYVIIACKADRLYEGLLTKE